MRIISNCKTKACLSKILTTFHVKLWIKQLHLHALIDSFTSIVSQILCTVILMRIHSNSGTNTARQFTSLNRNIKSQNSLQVSHKAPPTIKHSILADCVLLIDIANLFRLSHNSKLIWMKLRNKNDSKLCK